MINSSVLKYKIAMNIIKATENSEELKVSLSTAKRKIKALKENGKIERIGSDKNGHWKVV